MKNIFFLEMTKEETNGESVITIYGKRPDCMSVRELTDFIECLKTINDYCIKVAKERIENGKIKSKKRKR